MRILAVALLSLALTGCIEIAQLPSVAPSSGPTFAPFPTHQPAVEPTLAEPTPPPTETSPEGPTVPPAANPAVTADPNATPRPTAIDLLPYLSAQVTVVNLSDQPLSVSVLLLDPESTASYDVGSFDLQPLQVTTQAVVSARLHLQFYLGAGFHIGTCTINIGEGEQIQFAVLEDGIAFTTSSGEPNDATEMLVETAKRCAGGSRPGRTGWLQRRNQTEPGQH
jgi:hypothetical protein